MWGSRTRYFCKNVQGCDYARRDHVYWYADPQGKYLCNGNGTDGCGQELVAADTVNRTPLYLLSSVLFLIVAGYGGLSLYQSLNPAPLSGYSFAANTTQIDESSTVVAIQVVRSAAANPAQIHYSTQDRTATAGQDYIAEEGALDFSADEFEKTIKVTILPDRLFGEGVEEFMVVLTNTLNRAKHVVFISEPPQNTEAISSAQALVRNLSVVAMDIASYGKRVATISDLLQRGVIQDRAMFLGYQKVQETNEANLRRARERYIEVFRDLKTVPADAVNMAFDEWLASLTRRQYNQQHDATALAREHFQQFLSSGVMEMDIWQDELQKVIPYIEMLFKGESDLRT